MRLFLCGGCNRHIKESDKACPFCGTSARGSLVGDASVVMPSMSRAALIVGASVGAAVALAVTSCSSAPVYGCFPPECGFPVDASVIKDAGDAADAPHFNVDAASDAASDAPDVSDAALDASDAAD